MSVATKNLLFIHLPKAAGRWISSNLVEHVEGAYYIGDPTYSAHLSPFEGNLTPFICCRSPLDWLYSLWSHRARKKGLFGLRSFNWQSRHLLEQVPSKKLSFIEFLTFVAGKHELLAHYYLDHVDRYRSLHVIHQENLEVELIDLLNKYNEKFDAQKLRDASKVIINPTSRQGYKIEKPDFSKLPKYLIELLISNNQLFFEISGYTPLGHTFVPPSTSRYLDCDQLQSIKIRLNRNTSIGNHDISPHVPALFPADFHRRYYILNEVKLLLSPLRHLLFRFMNYLRHITLRLLLFLLGIYVKIKYNPQLRNNVLSDSYSSKSNSLKVELGGGETPLMKANGYMNVDVRPLQAVDIVSDVSGLNSHLQPHSVKSIFSRHFLEHLTFDELESHLKDCHVFLTADGIIEAIVPSMEFHLLQVILFPPSSSTFKHGLAGFHGWQRGQDLGYWDIHKSSFTYSSLLELFNRLGYKLSFIKTNTKNIHFLASKIS